MTQRDEEVQKLLAKPTPSSPDMAAVDGAIATAWNTVEDARDATQKQSLPLLDHGLHRDYYTLALEDLSTAIAALEQARRELVPLLVQGLHVPTTTVAEKSGLARTTVIRWAKP